MKFNPVTKHDSFVEHVWDLSNSNVDDFSLERIARTTNGGIDHLTGLINEALDKKGWDDTANHGNLPQGTFDIVQGQREYLLKKDISGNTVLKVLKVLLLQNGSWSPIEQFDLRDLNVNTSYFNDTPQAVPSKYDWNGDVIYFDVVPNYSLVDGAKVFFIRTADYVTDTDTNQEIGIAPIFHEYLAYYTAYTFAMPKGLANKNDLYNEMLRREKMILSFYAKQSKERPTAIRMLGENYE